MLISRKTFNLFALRFLVLLLASPLAFADSSKVEPPELRPLLETSADRAEYLANVQVVIPWLYSSAISYDTDFERLSIKEDQLIQALRAQPEYLELRKKYRGPLLQFKVSLSEQFNAKEKLSEKDLSWLRALSEKLNLTQEPNSTVPISEGLRYLDGVLTGLALALPAPLQKAAFTGLPSERLRFIRTHLSDDAFKANFRPERFGKELLGLSTSAVLDWAVSQAQTQEAFLQLMHRDVLTASPNLQNTGAPLRTEQAEALLHKWKAQWGKTAEEKEIVEKMGKDFLKRVSSLEKSPVKNVRNLSLVEVPPHYAAFRGFIGGDCSTSNSFGYPYSPLERVYFIYNETQQLIGYAGATLLETEGVQTLYIHDVTGKDLRPEQLKMVVYALERNKEKIGAARVAIATPSRLESNMHFPILIGALRQLSDPSPLRTQYLDVPVRRIIGRHVISKDYDRPGSNTRAHPLKSDPPFEERLVTESTPYTATPIDLQLLSKIPKRDALMVALALRKKSPTLALEMAKKAGFDKDRFAEAQATLENSKRLPLLEYAKQFRSFTNNLSNGVSTPESRRLERVIRARGLMRAPLVQTRPVAPDSAEEGELIEVLLEALPALASDPNIGSTKIVALAKVYGDTFLKSPALASQLFNSLRRIGADRIVKIFSSRNGKDLLSLFSKELPWIAETLTKVRGKVLNEDEKIALVLALRLLREKKPGPLPDIEASLRSVFAPGNEVGPDVLETLVKLFGTTSKEVGYFLSINPEPLKLDADGEWIQDSTTKANFLTLLSLGSPQAKAAFDHLLAIKSSESRVTLKEILQAPKLFAKGLTERHLSDQAFQDEVMNVLFSQEKNRYFYQWHQIKPGAPHPLSSLLPIRNRVLNRMIKNDTQDGQLHFMLAYLALLSEDEEFITKSAAFLSRQRTKDRGSYDYFGNYLQVHKSLITGSQRKMAQKIVRESKPVRKPRLVKKNESLPRREGRVVRR